jgi:hypothetical protein
MNPMSATDLHFFQQADDLAELLNHVSQVESNRDKVVLPTEERAAIAAEIMLYCDKFRAHILSRSSQNPRKTLVKIRRLYNL